ncbi:hypothetical protein LSAT2_012330, partial [Lamellibrachia satsuma]
MTSVLKTACSMPHIANDDTNVSTGPQHCELSARSSDDRHWHVRVSGRKDTDDFRSSAAAGRPQEQRGPREPIGSLLPQGKPIFRSVPPHGNPILRSVPPQGKPILRSVPPQGK